MKLLLLSCIVLSFGLASAIDFVQSTKDCFTKLSAFSCTELVNNIVDYARLVFNEIRKVYSVILAVINELRDYLVPSKLLDKPEPVKTPPAEPVKRSKGIYQSLLTKYEARGPPVDAGNRSSVQGLSTEKPQGISASAKFDADARASNNTTEAKGKSQTAKFDADARASNNTTESKGKSQTDPDINKSASSTEPKTKPQKSLGPSATPKSKDDSGSKNKTSSGGNDR